jgi:hypothetical protein
MATFGEVVHEFESAIDNPLFPPPADPFDAQREKWSWTATVASTGRSSSSKAG